MSPENQHRLELLRSVPLDSWVALSGDESRVVATAATYAEVSAKSDAAGENDPVILKTPSQWLPLSV